MKKYLILLLMILITLHTCSAAYIKGTVYDISFDKAKNTIVEINTEPKQVMVAKEGTYEFNVPLGNYILKATKNGEAVEENISVKHKGNFTLDLILFPSFEEEDDLISDIEEQDISEGLEQLEDKKDYLFYVGGMILIALIYFFIVFKRKIYRNMRKLKDKHIDTIKEKIYLDSSPQDDSRYLDRILEFLKHEGGRTTQKEIRKHIPLSEAKISLLLSELEHDCKIKKFKKGRSNVIVLKKP